MKQRKSAACIAVLAGVAGVAFAQEDKGNIEEVVVIGSRIPRLKAEGPAPITTLDATQIANQGLTNVPDILKMITQNSGATQSQQSFAGADFTPGAEQVDLRGLGPNHTLVLVNGRRIADFPLPFNGLSNFTDISNIPVGMIDRVEVLSGSASAIYGSDAIAGVVNFVLKKDVTGTEISYRYGVTEHGGGDTQRFSLSSGFARDKFHAVFGVELLDQKPLWAFERKIQDSTADDPTNDGQPVARRDFLRYDPDAEIYVDPGQATCAALSQYNKGTEYYGSRPGWGEFDDELDDYGPGHYCGSNEAIGWGTVLSERRGATGYASLNYELSDSTTLFADVMVGVSKVRLMNDVLSWNYMDSNGSEDGVFFNNTDGILDSWQRLFTPEEMGGLERGMIHSDQQTLTVTPGIKGKLGEAWNYEAYFNHSQYDVKVSWPQIVASRANELFLGESLGIDEDSGYESFDADIARLYTPLTRAEYDSIATRTVYHPKSRNDYASFTLTNGELFKLPAGPVGFAANVEAGNQAYELNPDPLALEYYYYGWRDQDGHGSRNHWAGSVEFRVPVFEKLELDGASRYDSYHFAGHDTGDFTYNFGLEYRPFESLLVRGYYGTGFRAPDLHYVFAGNGNVHSSGTDYYLCRVDEPDEDIEDCSLSDEGIVVPRNGNRDLKSETSKSWGAGLVWSPTENVMLSVDYFKVDLDNQVLDLDTDKILRDEADCRLGETVQGTPVDVSSPTCVDAISRVERYPLTNPVNPGGLLGVRVNPINIANENTDGVDVGIRWRIPLGEAALTFNGSYTKVFNHESQQFPGDDVVDQFNPESTYVIPRSKASASLTLDTGPFSGTLSARRLDRLANWDEDGTIPASIWLNASASYKVTDAAELRLTVDNLTDKNPVKDPTYRSYPYYDISWFDSVGRTFFLEINYNFGGK